LAIAVSKVESKGDYPNHRERNCGNFRNGISNGPVDEEFGDDGVNFPMLQNNIAPGIRPNENELVAKENRSQVAWIACWWKNMGLPRPAERVIYR